jgi:hypothetical protein
MEQLFQDLIRFMAALIFVECIVYVTSLWFVSYLSKKDDHDSSNNLHNK